MNKKRKLRFQTSLRNLLKVTLAQMYSPTRSVDLAQAKKKYSKTKKLQPFKSFRESKISRLNLQINKTRFGIY
jgi:hypothetical protein